MSGSSSSAGLVAMSANLQVAGLSYTYGSGNRKLLAVDNIGFDLQPGHIYVLLGANGSGKTTTLKVVGGLLPMQAGEIACGGASLKTSPVAYKQLLASVPDFNILYNKLRAYEYVELIAALWGLTGQEKNIRSLFIRLRLEDKMSALCETLSKGMQQKLTLIGALIHRPSVLILDEPFTGLDLLAIAEVKKILRDFAADGGVILLSTHILSFAQELATHVAFMRQGRIEFFDTLAVLRSSLPSLNLEDIVLDKFYAMSMDKSLASD